MSEAEMDSLTIKDMREQSAADGRHPKELVYVQPGDNLQAVIQQLFDNRASMAPVVTSDTSTNPNPFPSVLFLPASNSSKTSAP